MKRLFTLIFYTSTVLASPVDVLFDRTATKQQRELTSSLLPNSLSTQESIAELCYGIDICASSTPIEDLKQECQNISEEYKKDSDACQILRLREQNSCDSSLKKFDRETLSITNEILSDNMSLYSSYILKPILAVMGRKFNLDFEKMMAEGTSLNHLVNQKEVESAFLGVMKDAMALGQYTMNCYEKMNQLLFTRDQKKLTRHFNLFSSTINMLEHFPSHRGMVNRGTSLPDAALKEHHIVGNVVCYDGFTSTALHNPQTDFGSTPSNDFLSSRCSQRLYIKYEDNGAKPGKLISKASVSESENEVLFSPGACFRIDKVYPRTDEPSGEDQKDPEVCGEGKHYNFEMTLVPKPVSVAGPM